MWHSFLVFPPLLCFMVATWKLWEPEADPRFGWMLAGVGLQVVYLADQVLTGGSLWSIGWGLVAFVGLLYALKKTVALEQSTKRMRERRDENDPT